MNFETCYVMEDGSIAHPRDVKPDAQGVLRHADGRAVAMRGDVPRSRSVDIDALNAKAAAEAASKAEAENAAKVAAASAAKTPSEKPKLKDMKPAEQSGGYKTRETKAD